MDFIVAEEGVPVSVGAYGAKIVYYGSEIVLNYETEPPMGDFIFSAKLPLLNREIPVWKKSCIFRCILCFGREG